ncbi:condensin complex subunit 1 [Triplophysa rosa]|uniref:Condensin complex subunit 1 n=1 Tax=Triplophysa rosa TaxID=992332 RepID=A0A9W8C770_TRIRA|nr:condensin complex subunit 1 [Triplophysa rosa]XP_057190991.1 condensin complex subunit 1 [Triplophysa rosa]XP_057190992.1 condensin complex subunit 1 [Triplophysa rosa]XP_057190993.1 condensin complex subunit 1 [Triplophysa rosa]KAI7809455.1 putative condensin complex subunit 1 [Triplophysa rosa]
MSWDFILPICLDDLVKSGAVNQYVVQDVLSAKQLHSHLNSFKAALRSHGPLCILKHFDTVYSVLQHCRSVDVAVKEDTLELLIQVVKGLSVSLPTILLSASLSAADRKQQLNAVKMSIFLICKLTEILESDSYRETIVTAPSKGRKKDKAAGKGLAQWEGERETVLQCLTQLLQLDIRTLWSLSLVEEEFVSCVTCCCYKLLENPTISHMKSKSTRDAIIHVLGIMVKKYNHMLGACVKVIQLLQHFEQLASVCAQAVSAWSSEYGVKSIVGEIMREIGQKSSEELAREGSGVKAFSSFLSELSTLVPEAMIPNISVLLTHLEGESPSLRVAVCEVLGEVLVRVLTGDKLDDSARGDRNRFLDTLQEHIHDAHSHVRARVLQVYTRIVNSKALPLCRYTEVMELTVGRLGDKSVNVCKSSIQLLAAFIAHNPYSCKLSSVDLKKPLEKETGKLKEMRETMREQEPVAVITAADLWDAMKPEVEMTVNAQLEPSSEEERDDDEDETGGDEGRGDRDTAVQIAQFLRDNKYRHAVALCVRAHSLFPESPFFSALANLNTESLINTLASLFKGPEHETPEADAGDAPPTPQKEATEGRESELKKQEMLVQYLKDTESFALQVERAIADINNMLYWKTTTVVQEAVQFCVTAFEFSVADSVCGVRKMLPLVWSTDVAVKDAVIQAYRRMYLNPHGDSTRAKAQTLVDSLSELMINASLGTIQCLEEIVQEFFSSESTLQTSVVQVLWERFSGKRETSALHRRAAVLLLGMAARAEREVVLSNLDTLCSVALGEKVAEDYLLARDTLITIANITDHLRQSKGTPFRLPVDHQLFCCLSQAIADGVVQSDPHWQTFMEQAVRLIYFLAESPDQLCSHLLQRSARLLLEQVTDGGEPNQSQAQEAGSQSTEEQVSCSSLAQVLSLCGAVAFWQIFHLERSISAELRRRRGEREDKEEKEKAPASKSKEANDSCVEEELGLVGASAEDTEAEFIRKICETELLAEGNMLSVFLPLVVKVCSSPGRYSHPQLTTAACLALSQYMMISPAVCKDNIRLLFTVLEKSTLPVVRANTIVALGDLTVRFPNILEPWTPNLYARLSDENASVRLTAITVLAQLVLKDVMKVKGQVSEVAVLLLDPEPHIASLALNFFNELSAKDNAIYNLLPDIISRLSNPERGIKEEDFNTIMKQLFSYITKERQTESLVEKLCQRFRTAKTERQWADLATSLSLLSVCERGFKKLQECWDCYSDKLTEPGVYQPLLSIMAKLRRRAKPQFKAQVEDFEKRLTAVHTKGLENVEGEESQPQIGDTQSQNFETPQPQKNKRKTTRGRVKPKLDDSDLVTPKTTRSRPKPVITFTSDEEEQEEDAVMAESETPKVTTPIARTRRTRLRH